MAGNKSAVWHILLLDFILVAQRIERLGFTYRKGRVVVS